MVILNVWGMDDAGGNDSGLNVSYAIIISDVVFLLLAVTLSCCDGAI